MASEALQIIGDIGRIRVEPGDVLVITSPVSISVETCHRIVKAVTAIFPDHQVIFLDNGAKIEVARVLPSKPPAPQKSAEESDYDMDRYSAR